MAVLLRHLASQASSLRLIGASTIALAAALGANPAQAQNAFQGNPTVESGSVTFGGTVGQDTITVASNQAVINWAPNDTSVGGPPIDFLPVGNLALFVNDATLANDFTVLNRILPLDPTRAVALNGTIQSRFEDMVSGALTPGGGVWFYSQGGIVVGGTAVIDVGRFALTTADPVRDTGGNFIMSGQTVFQPAVSGTGVIVNPGASITASPENSYIALVAPYVRQNGSVNVNGSAAYVAAEAATVTVNQGLFDIVINQGSDGDGGNVAITHNGATTGPASAGVGDNHRIYMVAVPKNTAISMLVQASAPLGFDIAGAANVDGNAVVLSGGQGVSDRTFDATPGSTQIPTVNLINTSVTSALHIKSSGSTSVLSNTGPMNFASTALILGNNQALAEAIGINASLNFTNGVTVSADNIFTGGEARLVGGSGGIVNVTGDASITANAIGPVVVGVPAPPVTFQGGTTLVQANGGGAVNITGNLFNSADALAATYNAAGDGNNAIGGNARFFVNGAGSSAQVDGTVTLTASGFGSASLISGSGVNGNGTGGLVELNADSAGGGANSLTINGAVTLDASGNGASTPLGNAGIGLGGTAGLGAGVNGTVTALGTVSIFASGLGGSFLGAGAGNGGAGTGGIARLTIFGAGGSINASAGSTTVDAAGFGGAAGLTGGGNGGNGTGGQALIFVPMGSVTLGSSLVSALGSAGAGTNAPLSQGGNASVIAEGSGALALGNTSILANSIGSSNPLNAGLMGGATGGAALLTSRGAATLNVAGNVGIMANATGPGGLPTGVTGGAMQGGSADLIVAGGSVATITGAVQVFSDASANAVGGATSAAGSAQGGLANLAVNNTAQLTINGLTRVAAFGNGGLSINGPSGNGTGGTSNIQVNGGTLTINNDAQAVSRGNGGADAVSTQGGNAQGGNARIVANGTGGLITITGAATAESNAIAGFGLNGGNGTGGTSAISQGTGGRVAITGNANVEANGSGAIDNGGGDGIAGTGRGGDARITVNDNTLTIGGNAVVNANGSGGGGSSGAMTGGAGIGGLANIGAQASILTVTGASTVSALGRGGNSGASGSGGAGTGGQALVGVVNGAISEIRLGGANTNVARGEGGSAIGAGNSGGIGTGGTAQVFATTGAVRLNGTSSISDASASGGTGGAGANGGAATGGFAQYVAIGGTIAAAGSAIASANGFSGSVLSGTGNTGTATGGTALIGGGNHAGSMTIGGQAQALASATGGALNGGTAGLATAGISGFQVTQNGSIQVTGVGLARALATGSANSGGSGGNAQGGTAVMVITGGTGAAAINVGGNALIDARAVGGVGQGTNVNGGNATGGNARVNAFDGDMTFTSGLDVRAAGLGGSVGGGGSGNGGNGVGGNATVAARNGDIAVTGLTNTGIAALPQVSIFAFSGASGGNGAGGGNGGNATGGTQTVPNTEGGAQIVALNGATSASSITAASAWANASAGGGLGGAGAIGGAGGNATGGTTLLLGSAGNGQINFGLSVASTPGIGGRGGDGTTQGGVGGNAIGGFDQMGTQSGINNTASNIGSASLGTALLFSAATGGAGGNGSAGTGGAGGDATGGSGVLLVRGSQVSAAPLTLTATAQGGNGGTGTVAAGVGGDAISSGAGIFASERFQTTQRGTLTAGATTINAGATAGLGSTNGQAFTRDGSVLSITQADATLASFTLNSAAANEQAAVSTPAEIIVRDGNLTVTNGLLVAHDGDIAVQVSNGALNAGSFAVDGDNFVVSPSLPNPPTPGTITAGTINILSDDALVVQANLAGGTVTVSNLVNGVAAPAPVTLLNVSATDFSVQARGAFTAGNVNASTSLSGGVFLGSVTTGDVTAPDISVIIPAGDITTGAITVTGDLLLETANGNITTGNVTGGSDSDADFDASGNIITGNVTTGDSITALAGGTIRMGNLSAGIVNPSPAPGAGYSIAVAAQGNVVTGTLDAARDVGVASVAGTIGTGAINAGNSFLALADQDMNIGAITAGTGSTDFVYLADSSMLALGGPIDNFDPAPIFAATPVRSSGGVSTGAITGGNVLAAAGTGFTAAGAITGSQRVVLDSGGPVDLQGNVSAPQIGITASNLNLGANARLGTASTASLRLTANSGTGLLFGGTPTTLAVFQIDGSEAQRLQAQNINVQAGSIEIRDVTLLGSVAANPNLVGANGRLAISASGNISVTGAFAVNQMANSNEVAINADRLAVVTDQGSIILSGNSPGGTLSLRANDIHVARQNILTQLASNVNFTGRDAALAQGTGAGTPSLQAHQINLAARNSLLIQNNGSASEFAGFTAYSGGVDVTNIGFSPTNPAASTRLDMVIYGNLVDPVTGLVTADGSIRDTIIDRLRVGEFSLTSSINGCLLSAGACFASHDDGSGNILSGIEDRQESEEEEEKERDEEEEVILAKAASSSPIQPPVTIIDSRPMIQQPLLDDPITGGGNPAQVRPNPTNSSGE